MVRRIHVQVPREKGQETFELLRSIPNAYGVGVFFLFSFFFFFFSFSFFL